ncbi:MAG: hypothetical protein J1E40_10600 [Oscillospiraceae bacterium]|nr:hypothetical protein [Oscillospiraceae bacterium]
MIKLLRADFARLFSSRLFSLCVYAMLVPAILAVCMLAAADKQGGHYSPSDNMLFAGATYIGIVIAVLIGFFIGTDYSGGAVRNKLYVGHSKAEVYFSNLITCTSASLIMHIIWLVVVISAETVGIIRKFETPAGKIMSEVFVSIFAVSAMAAVFNLICMLIPSRSKGSVSAVVLSFIMLSVTDAFEGTPLYDVIPTCQIIQLTNTVPPSPWGYYMEIPENINMFPFYSLLIIVIATAVGVCIFSRKDLK